MKPADKKRTDNWSHCVVVEYSSLPNLTCRNYCRKVGILSEMSSLQTYDSLWAVPGGRATFLRPACLSSSRVLASGKHGGERGWSKTQKALKGRWLSFPLSFCASKARQGPHASGFGVPWCFVGRLNGVCLCALRLQPRLVWIKTFTGPGMWHNSPTVLHWSFATTSPMLNDCNGVLFPHRQRLIADNCSTGSEDLDSLYAGNRTAPLFMSIPERDTQTGNPEHPAIPL